MAAQSESLLDEYRSIWNNRLLEANGRSDEETLMEAIKRDLLDENSHPRIRKSIFEKYYLATKRIAESAISEEAKLRLVKLHLDMMKQLIQD